MISNNDVSEEPDANPLVLVSKLAIGKPFRFVVLRDTLAATWQPGKGVKITKLVTNLFLFQFYHATSLERNEDEEGGTSCLRAIGRRTPTGFGKQRLVEDDDDTNPLVAPQAQSNAKHPDRQTVEVEWKSSVEHSGRVETRDYRLNMENGENDELEFSGHQLTWERGIGTPNWVVERLDRILVFDAWMDFFGGAKAISCETPVCASYLPTADLLQIHIVNCDNLCPLCEFAAETSMHLFTLCPFAISCWNLSSLISHVISSSSLDEWIAQFLKALNSDSKCLFMLIYWYIWQSRNDKICNSQTTSPTTTVYKVKSHFSEWTSVNEKEVANTPTQQHFITKWEKPNSGWVKINVDGAADTQRRRMGIGWLIRDDKGAFLKVRSALLLGIYTPSKAEAMGLREILSWLKNQNLTHFHIEFGSLQVVKGLSSKPFDSSFDLLLLNVKDLLSIFPNAYILFVKRSGDRVAHLLAKMLFLCLIV
nr:uncharacterized protein LOC109164833 [Ipomoea batatas]